MRGMMMALAVLSGVVLGVALVLYGLPRAKAMLRAARRPTAACEAPPQDRIAPPAPEPPVEDWNELRRSVEGLAAQLQELRREPAPAPPPPPARTGLNLAKRSQALRLHRRGDSPEQIAATLEIPLQEIHLLIKVHRVVMSTV